MLNLIKRARIATEGDTSLEWLKPYMTERKYRRGDKLCKKDDVATEMFLTVTGKFLVREISIESRRDVSWANLVSLLQINGEPRPSNALKMGR